MVSSARRAGDRGGVHEETKMIGCLLFGAGFLMVAGKMAFRHHHGWHHGRWGHSRWRLRMAMRRRSAGETATVRAATMRVGAGGWDTAVPSAVAHGAGCTGASEAASSIRMLAERLDATPAQEKVLRDATEEFRETAAKLGGEGRKTRADVASTFRKGNFDEVMFGESCSRATTAPSRRCARPLLSRHGRAHSRRARRAPARRRSARGPHRGGAGRVAAALGRRPARMGARA